MTIFWFSLRTTLARLLVPFVVVNLGAWFCLASQPPIEGAGDDSAAVGRLWLHLPTFLLTVAALATALELWPLFTRGRRGGELVLRTRPGPLDGCGAIAAGSWCALALCLAPAGIAFHAMLSLQGFPQGEISTHVPLDPVERHPVLGSRHRALHFTVPGDPVLRALRLNPQAAIWDVDQYAPLHVEVLGDGEPLTAKPERFAGNNENLDIRFSPRRLREIELRSTERGTILLSFLAADSIEGIVDGSHSGTVNALLAAWSYLLPAALILAIACAGRRHLALPVSLAAGLAVALLGAVFDLTPNAPAIAAYSADRWVGGENLLAQSLPSLSMTVAALLLATLVGRRGRS